MTLLAQTAAPDLSRSWPEYVVVAAMVLAATLMFRAAIQVSHARSQRLTHDSPVLWLASGICFLIFALIKSLNMLAFAGVWLRELTRAQGVYDDRRPVQLLALSVIGLIAFVGAAALASHRRILKRHALLLACIGVVGLFGLSRFVSLHAVDAFMGRAPWLRPAVELPVTLIAAVYTVNQSRKLLRGHREPQRLEGHRQRT